MLLALALAVGFGYLRWSGQGLAGLMAGMKSAGSASLLPRPSRARRSRLLLLMRRPRPQHRRRMGPRARASPSPAGTPATGATDAGNAAPAAGNAPTGNSPSPSPASANSATANPGTTDAAAAPPAAGDAASNAPASGAAASDSPDKNEQPAAAQPVAKPAPRPKPPAAKPPAANAPDPVAAAEKYIYGRGAPQDCDRGMKTLRPAAAKGNAKAMISLGALYATGVCAPHDLPTAYHWFALALRKQPDDQPSAAKYGKALGTHDAARAAASHPSQPVVAFDLILTM